MHGNIGALERMCISVCNCEERKKRKQKEGSEDSLSKFVQSKFLFYSLFFLIF